MGPFFKCKNELNRQLFCLFFICFGEIVGIYFIFDVNIYVALRYSKQMTRNSWVQEYLVHNNLQILLCANGFMLVQTNYLASNFSPQEQLIDVLGYVHSILSLNSLFWESIDFCSSPLKE